MTTQGEETPEEAETPPNKTYLVSLDFIVQADNSFSALTKILSSGEENTPTKIMSQELEVYSE